MSQSNWDSCGFLTILSKKSSIILTERPTFFHKNPLLWLLFYHNGFSTSHHPNSNTCSAFDGLLPAWLPLQDFEPAQCLPLPPPPQKKNLQRSTWFQFQCRRQINPCLTTNPDRQTRRMADKKKQEQQDVYLNQLKQMVPGLNASAVSKVRSQGPKWTLLKLQP